MNVAIRIDYISASRISQSASFPLRGRKPETVALQWWKHLKKEISYRATLELVLADGNDITDQVKELEKKEWKNTDGIDNLPF
jgi:hypothetical protein